MARCGSPHPDDPTRLCLRGTDFHPDHGDDQPYSWPNTDSGVAERVEEIKASTRKRPKTPKRELDELAASVAKARIEYLKEERKRSFNRFTQQEGMAAAASSEASQNIRLVFFLAMAEVAVRQEYVTTNDAWDLLESRGFTRAGHAQVVGTIGGSGKSAGIWAGTGTKTENTSQNGHSTDNGVAIYRSLVLGRNFEADVVPMVIDKVAELDAVRQQKEEVEAAKVAVSPSGETPTTQTEADTSISSNQPRIWGYSS